MGFRRIGSSPCFGRLVNASKDRWSIDPDEVHTVEGEMKWIHREASKIGLPFGNWEDQLKWFEEHKDDLPMVYATATLQDDALVEHYKELANFHTPDEDWFGTNQFGRNALHVAALGFKAESVKWILQNDDIAEDLETTTTFRGYNPFQELRLRLDILRMTDGMSTLSDTFGGFCADAIDCLAMLRLPPIELQYSGHLTWLRLKFGCDCESCVGGVMSPSMRHVLLVQADTSGTISPRKIKSSLFEG